MIIVKRQTRIWEKSERKSTWCENFKSSLQDFNKFNRIGKQHLNFLYMTYFTCNSWLRMFINNVVQIILWSHVRFTIDLKTSKITESFESSTNLFRGLQRSKPGLQFASFPNKNKTAKNGRKPPQNCGFLLDWSRQIQHFFGNVLNLKTDICLQLARCLST